MNIWDFYRVVMNRLIAWNLANFAAGAVMMLRPGVWRGVGTQFAGWAVINFAIAAIAGGATQRRKDGMADPLAPEVVRRERRNLLTALLVNAGLDVLYMLGGWRLANTNGKRNALMRGMGFGIIFQGLFLFIHDLYHAIVIPPKPRS